MAKDDLNQRYWFTGEGLGVPGLPHEVSMQEAIELGVDVLLKAAIGNGAYAAVTPSSAYVSSSIRFAQREPLSAQRDEQKE